jgi:hypothetical protein
MYWYVREKKEDVWQYIFSSACLKQGGAGDIDLVDDHQIVQDLVVFLDAPLLEH